MEGITVDLFATKGIEYLLVITYLVLLVCGWRLVFPARQGEQGHTHHDAPSDLYFHQGHMWARLEANSLGRVGIDDFAQRALGLPVRFIMPNVGSRVAQGEPVIGVHLPNGEIIPLVCPVDGVVVGVNHDVIRSPGITNTQPYDEGWLLHVRLDNPTVIPRNLLSGRLAETWLEESMQIPAHDALDELMMMRFEKTAAGGTA